MDETIFKAYDIRGIYPEQIDEDLMYKIGQAYNFVRNFRGLKNKE